MFPAAALPAVVTAAVAFAAAVVGAPHAKARANPAVGALRLHSADELTASICARAVVANSRTGAVVVVSANVGSRDERDDGGEKCDGLHFVDNSRVDGR